MCHAATVSQCSIQHAAVSYAVTSLEFHSSTDAVFTSFLLNSNQLLHDYHTTCCTHTHNNTVHPNSTHMHPFKYTPFVCMAVQLWNELAFIFWVNVTNESLENNITDVSHWSKWLMYAMSHYWKYRNKNFINRLNWPGPLVLNQGGLPVLTTSIESNALPLRQTDAVKTSSSAVAKRPCDASCLSVVSFNSTKRRVVFYC